MTNSKAFLKDSLIFQMSLGSKELFHSNIWAWLMEKESKIVNVFFDIDLTKFKILKIDREYSHRDIIIWLEELSSNKKYYLLIENKIKSLPTKEQLEKYTVKLSDSELLDAVFTGMVNPFNENLQINNIIWRFINYHYIAGEIERIVNESIKFKYTEKEEIFEYCKVIFHMDKLLTEELQKSVNKLSYNYDLDKPSDSSNTNYIGLNNLRINDLFIKLKGATFIDYVKRREDELPKIDGYNLHIGQSFHNGKATLDVRYTNWKDNVTPWLCLGVQLEGHQYRKIAERGNFTNTHAYIYNEFEEKGWFDKTFNKHSNNKIVFGKKTSMTCRNAEKYNIYTGDNYRFVYQYYDITDENNNYNELFLNIKQDIIEAKNILEIIM